MLEMLELQDKKKVVKRNGTVELFNTVKTKKAVQKCLVACNSKEPDALSNEITGAVLEKLPGMVVDVEQVQDVIETVLMEKGLVGEAKAFILYRQDKARLREQRLKPDQSALANYIHLSKYARFLPDRKRRELYSETVSRVETMHLNRFPQLQEELRWAFDRVYDRKVLPSMRSMQFGGQAMETNNARGYNCSFSFCDRPRFFQESLFLLLSGCGVGYSVQFHHVDKLPALKWIDKGNVVHHVIADSIEGWGNALGELVNSYIKGYYVEFSYHRIRDRNVLLKTSGGRAPGHLGLKKALDRARQVLDGAQGRQLRPIECHRIQCAAADAALSGGIRRSAMICLFSPEDGEMMVCKTGNWYNDYPEYANANNSVVLLRGETKKDLFRRVFKSTKEWGEPGFYFTSSTEYGTNPYNACGAIQ